MVVSHEHIHYFFPGGGDRSRFKQAPAKKVSSELPPKPPTKDKQKRSKRPLSEEERVRIGGATVVTPDMVINNYRSVAQQIFDRNRTQVIPSDRNYGLVPTGSEKFLNLIKFYSAREVLAELNKEGLGKAVNFHKALLMACFWDSGKDAESAYLEAMHPVEVALFLEQLGHRSDLQRIVDGLETLIQQSILLPMEQMRVFQKRDSSPFFTMYSGRGYYTDPSKDLPTIIDLKV